MVVPAQHSHGPFPISAMSLRPLSTTQVKVDEAMLYATTQNLPFIFEVRKREKYRRFYLLSSS
jgi:hypothetical protein